METTGFQYYVNNRRMATRQCLSKGSQTFYKKWKQDFHWFNEKCRVIYFLHVQDYNLSFV
jgi:hypothetical protein